MKKMTKLSISWFYELLEKGECDIMDFKEQLEDKEVFGKSLKNYGPNYEEMARDVVAFANKKGGFLFLGITDKTKEVNTDFSYTDEKIFDLIKQVQDRTQPLITLVPHKLTVSDTNLLVLEIPFSMQIHCTTKGEYIIRCNNGNRPIQPHEMATIMSEKNLIVYDQKTWRIYNWQDEARTSTLYNKIKDVRADSPLLKDSREDFNDAMNLEKDEMGELFPTTTGILLVGNNKALKELPYSEIKYVRYYEDGTYKPYEWKGNLIEIADGCFNQLKSEIKQREFHFGLFHDFIEDYSETVIRELLINAIVHRDYSRQQCIEIRKYPTYMEIESPGTFPDGVDINNMLRKTNPKNPSIIEAFRAIRYAEKAGSGFDKISADYLEYGQNYKPYVTSTNNYFTLVLPNVNVVSGMINKNTTNFDIVYDDSLMLSERQKIILKFCYFSPKSINEIASFLNMKVSSYLRNDFLNRLVNMNVLKVNRDEKAALYFTTHDTVKILSIRKENI